MLTERAQHLEPAEARHLEVGDYKLDRWNVLPDRDQRSLTVGCLNHRTAVAFEEPADHGPDQPLVIGDQNGCRQCHGTRQPLSGLSADVSRS